MERLRKDRKAILVFLLPGLLVYTALLILPIFGALGFSFFKWNGIKGSPMTFVGFTNFVKLMSDAKFWTSMKNIAWFLTLTMLTQLPIGLMLALLLSKQMHGYKFFKAAYFVPQVLSTTVISLVWYFILMPQGTLNTLMNLLGLEEYIHVWLSDPATAMTTIILVNTWAGIGFHMTVNYAAIQAIPADIMEASVLDGCMGIRKVFCIVIPLIWESIVSCMVIIITVGMKTFDLVYVMTNGGPNGLTDVPSTLLYKRAFLYDNFGSASAIGVILFLLSIILTVLSLRITRRETVEL